MEFPSTCFSLLGTKSSLFALEFSLDSSASCEALSIATGNLCFVLSPHLFSLPKPLCLIPHHRNLTATPLQPPCSTLIHSLQVACTQDRLRAQICPPSISPTYTPHHLLPRSFYFSLPSSKPHCVSHVPLVAPTRRSVDLTRQRVDIMHPSVLSKQRSPAIPSTAAAVFWVFLLLFYWFFCFCFLFCFVFVFVFVFCGGLRRVKGPFEVWTPSCASCQPKCLLMSHCVADRVTKLFLLHSLFSPSFLICSGEGRFSFL